MTHQLRINYSLSATLIHLRYLKVNWIVKQKEHERKETLFTGDHNTKAFSF